ncbi:MAG: ABC transporter ATP-binding protein [Actinomycetota bacterium]
MTTAIELEGITKRFPGVVANDNVNLRVEQGEIHAICGENGAGKSTLMKILYGMQAADEGVMRVNGDEVNFSSPTDAIDHGIGMVHQHFMLADQLTVLENVILGAEPDKRSLDLGRVVLPAIGFIVAAIAILLVGNGVFPRVLLLAVLGGVALWWFGTRIDFTTAESRLKRVADDYGLTVDLRQVVETLEVGERQRVEIIKVLYRGAEILILDEPTAVLVPQEVEALFDNMRELKANGATILFIDHKLEEVLEIADSITVLRHGKTVASMKNEGVTAHELAELMVGSELPTPETSLSTVTEDIALEIRNLSMVDDGPTEVEARFQEALDTLDEAGAVEAEQQETLDAERQRFRRPETRRTVDDVSIVIHRGEILGIAGVEGNGQGDLVNAIIGTEPIADGSIHLHGTDISHWSVRRRREAGIGYVPEDRHREGLLLESPLWENAALGHQTQAPYGSRWFLDRNGAREQTERIREAFDVRTPNIDVSAHALSGGNQQKLIIGRELTSDPSLLVASHPTRGIDVGAQAAVWDQIRQARADGLATLLISADLDELIGLSDTIVVMFRGRLVARLSPDDVTPRDLGAYMTGAALQGSPAGPADASDEGAMQ